MGFFSRLLDSMKGKPPTGDRRYYAIYVLSTRCREPIAGQVDLLNEVSLDDDGKGYYGRKVLHTSGKNRCFGQVEVELWFDMGKRLLRQEVQGGRWLTPAEYAVELAQWEAAMAQQPDPQPPATEQPAAGTDEPAPPTPNERE